VVSATVLREERVNASPSMSNGRGALAGCLRQAQISSSVQALYKILLGQYVSPAKEEAVLCTLNPAKKPW